MTSCCSVRADSSMTALPNLLFSKYRSSSEYSEEWQFLLCSEKLSDHISILENRNQPQELLRDVYRIFRPCQLRQGLTCECSPVPLPEVDHLPPEGSRRDDVPHVEIPANRARLRPTACRDRLFPRRANNCHWATSPSARRTAAGSGGELTIAATTGLTRHSAIATSKRRSQAAAGRPANSAALHSQHMHVNHGSRPRTGRMECGAIAHAGLAPAATSTSVGATNPVGVSKCLSSSATSSHAAAFTASGRSFTTAR